MSRARLRPGAATFPGGRTTLLRVPLRTAYSRPAALVSRPATVAGTCRPRSGAASSSARRASDREPRLPHRLLQERPQIQVRACALSFPLPPLMWPTGPRRCLRRSCGVQVSADRGGVDVDVPADVTDISASLTPSSRSPVTSSPAASTPSLTHPTGPPCGTDAPQVPPRGPTPPPIPEESTVKAGRPSPNRWAPHSAAHHGLNEGKARQPAQQAGPMPASPTTTPGGTNWTILLDGQDSFCLSSNSSWHVREASARVVST